MRLSICVNYKFAIILLFVLLPQSADYRVAPRTPDQQGTMTADTASHGEGPAMSDRERAGLRGSVEQCTEETITPPGPNHPEMRYGSTTKYDPTGRILHIGYTNADGSKAMGSTGDGEPRQSSAFQYDDQGRKTRIVRSESKPSSFGADDRSAVSFDAENDDLFIPTPAGGLVKTLFNERDQPTESQVYEANGQLTSRLVRRYDAKGARSRIKLRD